MQKLIYEKFWQEIGIKQILLNFDFLQNNALFLIYESLFYNSNTAITAQYLCGNCNLITSRYPHEEINVCTNCNYSGMTVSYQRCPQLKRHSDYLTTASFLGKCKFDISNYSIVKLSPAESIQYNHIVINDYSYSFQFTNGEVAIATSPLRAVLLASLMVKPTWEYNLIHNTTPSELKQTILSIISYTKPM